MAIATERFKFLDKENNLFTVDFNKLDDNSVHNYVDEVIDSAFTDIKEKEELINNLNNFIGNVSNEITKSIDEVANTVLDEINNTNIPSFVKDVFDLVKNVNLDGVESSLKDLISFGRKLLCDGINIKLPNLGIDIDLFLGLVIDLALKKIDLCRDDFTTEEVRTMNPVNKIEEFINPKGLVVTEDNVFDNFTQVYSSFLKSESPIQLTQPPGINDFLNNVISGNIGVSIKILRNSEISFSMKQDYLSSINNKLSEYASDSIEYKNLLSARGELIKLPLISEERRNKNIQFENLSDKIGTMAKNIKEVSLTSVDIFNMSKLEKDIFNKIKDFKNNSMIDLDLNTRSNNTGSFRDYDFTRLMPEISDEEKEYLLNLNYKDTSHRIHDIHPTTEVFLWA